MRTKVIWTTIAILFAVNMAWLVWVQSKRQVPVPIVKEAPDITADVPIQRGRIDKFIETVKSESLDDCIDHLNFHEALVVRAALNEWEMVPWPHATEQCLANRRLARVFEEFSRLPADERVRRSQALFAKTLADFRGAIDTILTRWENDNPPQSATELFGEQRSLDGYFWAFCGSQLICAQFCPLEVAIANQGTVRQLHESTEARVQKDPTRLSLAFSEIRFFTDPDLFHINLARHLYSRHFRVSDIDALVPDEMTARDMPFYAWNAHTNEHDFTYQRRGVEPDREHIVQTFSFYERWHTEGLGSRAVRRPIVDRCWDDLSRRAQERR
jgi:hypothetical protein